MIWGFWRGKGGVGPIWLHCQRLQSLSATSPFHVSRLSPDGDSTLITLEGSLLVLHSQYLRIPNNQNIEQGQKKKRKTSFKWKKTMLEGMSSRIPQQHTAWSHWALTRSTTGGRNSKRENHINSFFLSEWRVMGTQSVRLSVTEANVYWGRNLSWDKDWCFHKLPSQRGYFSWRTFVSIHTRAQHSHKLDRQTDKQPRCCSSVRPINTLGSFVSWQAEKTICGGWEWNTRPHLDQHAHAPSGQLSSLNTLSSNERWLGAHYVPSHHLCM